MKQKIYTYLLFFYSILFLFVTSPSVSFAVTPTISVKNPCSATSCPTGLGVDVPTDIGGFIGKLFGIVLSVSGVIAVSLIIFAGYRLGTSQGNQEAVKEAQEQLTSAIIGLLFVIFSTIILRIIGIDILQIPGFIQ